MLLVSSWLWSFSSSLAIASLCFISLMVAKLPFFPLFVFGSVSCLFSFSNDIFLAPLSGGFAEEDSTRL